MVAFPRVLSLCSGVGQLDAGVRVAFPSARTVLYVEREAFTAAVLVARMESGELDEAPIWSDAGHLPVNALRGRVDMAVGGIPCQPFSRAGERRGTDDERWLWPIFWRAVRDVGARYIFLENVADFTVRGLAAVAADLAAAGWSAEWGVYRASEVGASELRPRFFLLGHAGSARLPDPQSGGIPGAPQGEPDPRPATLESGRPSVPAVFPPGRDNHRAWRSLLPERPWLSPAVESTVRGVATGVATGLDVCGCPRADRIHAIGNSACPQQVAYALADLGAALWGRSSLDTLRGVS